MALLTQPIPTPPRDRRERERALGVLLRKGYETESALDALVARADCVAIRAAGTTMLVANEWPAGHKHQQIS